MSRPFKVGDVVIVSDKKQRRNLVSLSLGGQFHTHAGFVPHESIIDKTEGVAVKSTKGATYRVMRPTLSDYVLSMPRGAQVIYPKDLGPILMIADIFPGAKVFESGVGSGALSMALIRAGASVHGYEIREDFATVAKKNVATFFGPTERYSYEVEIKNSYEGIDSPDSTYDRMVLDLPEPWNVAPHAANKLTCGGIFLAYLPSIVQVAELVESLADNKFKMIETVEFLRRTWHVDGRSVRPDHRMVAHTGFLVSARKVTPDSPEVDPSANNDSSIDSQDQRCVNE